MQLRLRLARADHPFERALQVLHIGRGALVQNHQVHGELFQSPVFVCLQQLAGDRHVLDMFDP